MVRTSSALIAAAIIMAALAPAQANHDTREDRKAQALWPSERPYYVDHPEAACYPKLLTVEGRFGPRRVWVKNIRCLAGEPDNLVSDLVNGRRF